MPIFESIHTFKYKNHAFDLKFKYREKFLLWRCFSDKKWSSFLFSFKNKITNNYSKVDINIDRLFLVNFTYGESLKTALTIKNTCFINKFINNLKQPNLRFIKSLIKVIKQCFIIRYDKIIVSKTVDPRKYCINCYTVL